MSQILFVSSAVLLLIIIGQAYQFKKILKKQMEEGRRLPETTLAKLEKKLDILKVLIPVISFLTILAFFLPIL
ncbi:hypothetical protein [Halobacillus sp. A5]|uniref:hypothetical protein n=1 Tax=Halobacillus sp. A5 TaxID=2880263 RepID=UPI0020A66223|nr:hypothetical protein [Halobacillus sp. A5]MCP3027177.1 hypothetical protein [Halobacillus sp. A5]